jgi:hypothetical protein
MGLSKYGTLKPRSWRRRSAGRKGFVLEQGDVDMLHTATADFRKTWPRAPSS